MLVLSAALLSACVVQPTLPSPSDGPASAAAGAVFVEPAADLGAVPPVLRIHVSGADLDAGKLLLVRGHAGPAQVSQVRKGQISAALGARVVPAAIWSEPAADTGDEEAPPASRLVLAPTVALDRGEEYTLLGGDPPGALSLRVAADDAAPLLERIWPPEGASATDRFAVWCGEGVLGAISEEVTLAPDGPPGRFVRGVAPGDPGPRCLRFDPDRERGGGATGGLPPTSLTIDDDVIRLDPRRLQRDGEPHPVAPLACADGEVAFGPGCAAVSDDRIEVRSPGAPLLWSIQGEGVDLVFPSAAGAPFVVSPLPPSTAVALAVAAVDDRGVSQAVVFTAQTLAPRPHLILNEVLANPLGPEPEQEWVEILNDGSAPAELGGFVLMDVGGETVLPAGALAPGGFALVVNQAFSGDDGLDPAPEKGTLLLRVKKLGQGGLSNDGEPLSLRDPQGAVVSRFPVGPKTKSGMSVARVFPAAPDALASAFVVSQPTPGRANAP